MSMYEGNAERLLADARERGDRTLMGTIIPPGLDQFSVYVGLISSALELGKLIQTEERDLTVIGNHHEREMAEINTAFKKVESKMLMEFQHNDSLRAQTFEAIKMLIAAGQHEIALKFYERMMDGFKHTPLETIIQARNSVSGNTRLELK